MPRTDAQRRAKARYEQQSVTHKRVSFYPTERDLAEWCEASGEPFATYVKRLIREDMERHAAQQ